MQLKTKWEIWVQAGSYYPNLMYTFYGQDIELSYENDDRGMQFFAYSDHIQALTDPQLISRRLYSLQLLLNGALRISSASRYEIPVKFTDFFSRTGGHHTVNADSVEDNPFSADPSINVANPRWRSPKSSDPAYLLHVAKSDSDLRKILFLAGLISADSPIENILTWGTLYKILDCVRHHSKRCALDVKAFADPKEIEKFSAACNSMSILGLYARHGASSNTAPTKVITNLRQATDLVLSLAHNFSDAYVRAQYP